MTEEPGTRPEERLILFDIGATTYALPIAAVLEVSEPSTPSCVPTLPAEIGGVLNHHGDALPVVTRGALFDVVEEALSRPSQLLVVADEDSSAARFGLPVDRVCGLVNGRSGSASDENSVVDKRPIESRVVSVLDAKHFLGRAREVIARAAGSSGPLHGGEE